ncbi:hypothetical protein AVEN_151309-1 [Araneus ventricosus]|uniref:Uncharacterized protein n=1 Tax=Araneus ventricosus TaxID=182803 RepID=A0A4Y2I102_ARAVE|nr:hypothetical protein AVEN_48329-1 [Araneus ventricosus]GBM71490.1 hypothetical protein AVEN_61383-1 [Araneus ventricosus]GBM71534.1 hypothetical protein AVEN_151309-1 [Araneus ventricosus]
MIIPASRTGSKYCTEDIQLSEYLIEGRIIFRKLGDFRSPPATKLKSISAAMRTAISRDPPFPVDWLLSTGNHKDDPV